MKYVTIMMYKNPQMYKKNFFIELNITSSFKKNMKHELYICSYPNSVRLGLNSMQYKECTV